MNFVFIDRIAAVLRLQTENIFIADCACTPVRLCVCVCECQDEFPMIATTTATSSTHSMPIIMMPIIDVFQTINDFPKNGNISIGR